MIGTRINDTQGTEVILNVYFLGDSNDPNSKRAQALAPLGLGLYHSGVEINGLEFAYGGDTSHSNTGVFQSGPLSAVGATYHCSYLMGVVHD